MLLYSTFTPSIYKWQNRQCQYTYSDMIIIHKYWLIFIDLKFIVWVSYQLKQ